ncbi:MAG: hypothetical protein EB075_11450 [Bacteroidetes bacterium]|nr:hypothetical protein [Bacteroidota bacterium]
MKVYAVLLVPAEGDPHGLLREGMCGARPPLAWMNGPRWVFGWASERAHVRALVLAWGGKPVPEGIQRSVHAAKSRAWVEHLVGCALGRLTDDVDVLSDPDLPGTLILLDAEGREVSDEI